jgi:hypothetical protein
MERLKAHFLRQSTDAPLIDRPDFEALLAAGRFGAWSEQAKEMHARGYCTLNIDTEIESDASELIKELGASMATELENWEAGKAGAPRLQDGWQQHPAVRRLALQPRVLAVLRQLYGREPFAFQTLNFAVGSEQPFHSDAVHFHCEPHGFMCGLWIPLADVEPDSGPLLYYPGSHRLPYRSAASLGLTPEQVAAEPHPQRFFEPTWQEDVERLGLEREIFLPRRGEALIWHANLLHGGSAVKNRRARRWSLVVHYYFKGCRYTTPMHSFPPEQGGPFLRDPFNIATGKTIGASARASTSALTPKASRKHDQGSSRRIPLVRALWFWQARRKKKSQRSLQGSIETLSPTLITGWIFHPEIPFCEVRLVSGSQLVASAPIDGDRPDVAAHVGRSGCFGFTLAIPDSHPIPAAADSVKLLAITADGRLSCPVTLRGALAAATEDRLRTALSATFRGLVGHFDGLSTDGGGLQGWCYSRLGGAATVWLQSQGLPPRPLTCREPRADLVAEGHPEESGFAFPLQGWPEAAGREVWASFDEEGDLRLPQVMAVRLPEQLPSAPSRSAQALSTSVISNDLTFSDSSQQAILMAGMDPDEIPVELQAHWRVLQEFRQLLDRFEHEIQRKENQAYENSLPPSPAALPTKKRASFFKRWK